MKLWINLNQFFAWSTARIFLKLTGSELKIHLTSSDFDRNTGYVIAANHQNRLDPFVICAALPFGVLRQLFPLRFMGYWQFFTHTLLRWLLTSLGTFPTKPVGDLGYGLPFSQTILADHGTVFIFPEGKRTLHGEATQAKNGVSVLASQPNTKVILCHIVWRTPRLRGAQIIVEKPRAYSDATAQEILEDIYRLAD